MDRRTMMAAAAAAMAGRAAAATGRADLRRLGYDALVYLLPLYEMMAARTRTLAQGGVQNVFRHVRKLATAKSRDVTTPNNDTLYSVAWLDLSAPVEITLPHVGGRYFSLALMDAYTNNFEVLGGAERAGAETVRLVHGAARADTAGVRTIRSPTRLVWALARTYAGGEADLPTARALQDQLTITTPAVANPMLIPTPGRGDLIALLSYAQAALVANPPPTRDRAMLRRLATLGLGAAGVFPPDWLSPAQLDQIRAGAMDAMTDLRRDDAKPLEGWFYEKPDTGNFGIDYVNRARVALTGLAALPPSEAFYLKGAGDRGDGIYDGTVDHRIVFPRGALPPTDAFWSVTLYEPTPEGRLFFFDNSQGRYSIGSNSGDLAKNADGAVTLMISARAPEPSLRANWLPAPAGPFRLQFRAFRPGAALLSGAYRVPPVQMEGGRVARPE